MHKYTHISQVPINLGVRWRAIKTTTTTTTATTTTTTTLRPLVRARFWLHSSQFKRAKMCIFIHWQQCFHASCARSKCIVKNNVSWWRLLVMIAFLFKFFWKIVQNSKNAWVFWKNVLRIGFSHANATSHFQWSWVSYVICNKKCTLLTSVFWEVLASFFWRMWNLCFLNKNRHDAQATLELSNFNAHIKKAWYPKCVHVFRNMDHVRNFGSAQV